MAEYVVMLNDNSERVLALAMGDFAGTSEEYLSETLNKHLKSAEKAIALSQVRQHKGTAMRLVQIGRHASLEECYIKLAFSDHVELLGGISEVYSKIFRTAGLFLPAEKITIAAAQKAAAAQEVENA